MPQMGVSVTEGTIAEWKKRPGDWVERDETIVEISTDKIETEIPSPVSGRVVELLVEVGVTVPVGEVLAKIDSGSRPGQAHADEHPVEEKQESGVGSRELGVGNGPSGGHAPPISPIVRRIAAEHDVDLEQVEGTGMRGRITKKDVMRFIEQKPEAEPVLHMESPYVEEGAPTPNSQLPTPVTHGEQSEPLSIVRKQIGAHMRRSLDTAAHCTTIVEADMSRIEAARKKDGLSYLPYVARAVIGALREYPKYTKPASSARSLAVCRILRQPLPNGQGSKRVKSMDSFHDLASNQ